MLQMWLLVLALFCFNSCYSGTGSDKGSKNEQWRRQDENSNYDGKLEPGLDLVNNQGYGDSDEYGRSIEGYKDQTDANYRAYGRQGYRGKQRDSYDEEEKERLDKIFGYTGPTANDEPENLIRPCALDDWQCIRKYFAANSKCTSSYGPISDPLQVDLNTFFLAFNNLTISFTNSQVRGLSSARINDFYVNKKSGNLVFAIDIQNLNLTSAQGYFRYRRTARESIILGGYATVVVRSLTFTAVIPKVPHLRLDLADIHVDSQDGTPLFFVGPRAANSTDPDVLTAFAQIPLLLPIVVREGLLFASQILTAVYIQDNICDFGLKLISV